MQDDDSQWSSPSRSSLVLRECIKRFREQPPAPLHKRSPLPFKNEDFWWKKPLDAGEDEEDMDRREHEIGEDFEEEALRQSISLLTRSTLSAGSRALSSIDSQGEGDLDVYASTLLARCDRLMREYEAKREHVGMKAGIGVEAAHRAPKDEKEEEEEAPPPPPPSPAPPTLPHRSPRRSPGPAASPCSSADSVFPLYLSYSDSEPQEREGEAEGEGEQQQQDHHEQDEHGHASSGAQSPSLEPAALANSAAAHTSSTGNSSSKSNNSSSNNNDNISSGGGSSSHSLSKFGGRGVAEGRGGGGSDTRPLTAAEVAPFLGDEVVAQLWARLGLIRQHIARGVC